MREGGRLARWRGAGPERHRRLQARSALRTAVAVVLILAAVVGLASLGGKLMRATGAAELEARRALDAGGGKKKILAFLGVQVGRGVGETLHRIVARAWSEISMAWVPLWDSSSPGCLGGMGSACCPC